MSEANYLGGNPVPTARPASLHDRLDGISTNLEHFAVSISRLESICIRLMGHVVAPPPSDLSPASPSDPSHFDRVDGLVQRSSEQSARLSALIDQLTNY